MDITIRYESFMDSHEVYAMHEESIVGTMMWDDSGEISWIEVNHSMRRQGVGRRMWEYSQQCDPPARHSPVRSRLGDLWARSVGGYVPERNGNIPEHLEDVLAGFA